MKQKLLILSLLLTLAAVSMHAQTDRYLFPNNKYITKGYDREKHCQVVYNHNSEVATGIFEFYGLDPRENHTYAPVKMSPGRIPLFNFIDLNGRLIFHENVKSPIYDRAPILQNGVAIVKADSDENIGFNGVMDSNGNWIIKPDKRFVAGNYVFPECGTIFVEDENHKCRILNLKNGFVEIEGNEQSRYCYSSKHPFSGGAAFLKDGITGKYGLVNIKGEFIIKPIFDDVIHREYSRTKAEGIFVVQVKNWAKIKKQNTSGIGTVLANNHKINAQGGWGVVDSEGNWLLEPCAKEIGYGIYGESDGVWMNITKNNKLFVSKLGVFNDYLYSKYSQNNSFSEYLLNQPWNFYVTYKIGTHDEFIDKTLREINLSLPITPSEEYIKTQIHASVDEWQKKGMYESTTEWEERVNQITLEHKINEVKKKIIEDYDYRVRYYLDGVQRAENKYNSLLKECFHIYTGFYTDNFAKQKMELMPYDADNETFLIRTEKDGDILLHVPRSEARSFADNWELNKSGVKPEFVVNGDRIALKQVRFGNYVYDGKTEANYASTSAAVTEFAPLDLSSITAADMNFEAAAAMPATVASVSTPKAKKQVVSDVDVNIPKARKALGENTFALVIGNENYRSAVAVEGALNDSRTFAKYLTETYGIPERQIFLHTDATLGDITSAVGRLKNVAKAVAGKDFDVIVYYAGHGVPDDANRSAYLLPVDVDPVSVNVCPTLEGLYADLGSLGARQVTVFLDACFSGAVRGDGMLSHARGIAIKANPGAPKGNTIVLSAASGQETAFPHPQQGHGLFTYFLLKKLQETGGKVTIGELADYVTEKVSRESVLLNNKPQTPTVIRSTDLGDAWRSLPLIR